MILAAGFIENGMVDAAIAGGVEVADIHFFAGFDFMRAYNGQDNDRPERASRPYARIAPVSSSRKERASSSSRRESTRSAAERPFSASSRDTA